MKHTCQKCLMFDEGPVNKVEPGRVFCDWCRENRCNLSPRDVEGERKREADAVKAAGLQELATKLRTEADQIPLGAAFRGGGLHNAAKYDVWMWAVRMIEQAARELRGSAPMLPEHLRGVPAGLDLIGTKLKSE